MFLKALLKMKRDQQRETFQSRLTVRSQGLMSVQPQISHAPFVDETSEKYQNQNNPPSRAKQYKPINVPVAKPHVVNGFPKQFILARPETPTSSDFDSEDEEFNLIENDVYNPSMGKFPSTSTMQQSVQKQRQQQIDRFDREYFTFSDLDYEMPQEVREVLHEEGLDPSTVESWLHKAEACHRRALAMRRFESAKLVKTTKKNITLPPIKAPDSSPQPISGQLDKEGHPQRRSASPTYGKHGALPDIIPVQQEDEREKGHKVCEDMKRVLTEAEEMKWRCEQQLERIAMPTYDYVPPRLVLISSRIPWCHSLTKAIKRDDSKILYLVYDFEHWSFQDILDAARELLDTDRRGCKARSVFLLCKGGAGYFYLLRNYVMTPQKLSRPRYKVAREFWHSMGALISKLEPEDAKIHLLGADLENNHQGRKLIHAIWKMVHPNKVEVICPLENTAAGQDCVELYFDYRKFLLWRSRPVSSYSLLESNDLTRSWSSLEEEALRKERVHDIIGT